MISKILSTVVASVTLSGAVVVASIAPGTASPCAFKQGWNSGNNTIVSDGPSTPTDSSVNSSINGVNNSAITSNHGNAAKFGIAGVALLGLVGGGLVLKSRWAKQPASSPAADELEAPTTYRELPSFPIEVPAEALAARQEDEVLSER
ncbi:MAG: hypothetical protein ACKO7W_22535 [Elainella sp.]